MSSSPYGLIISTATLRSVLKKRMTMTTLIASVTSGMVSCCSRRCAAHRTAEFHSITRR